eukprot:jgi/Botrbrau1/10241/Bobra.0362s0030.1
MLFAFDRRSQRCCGRSLKGKLRRESDTTPAVFWVSNTLNYLHGNAASGGAFGIWFEMRRGVRGTSQTLHGSQDLNPIYTDPISDSSGNVVHSNGRGLSLYRRGYNPPTEPSSGA